MDRLQLNEINKAPDLFLSFLYTFYISIVLSCLILYKQITIISIFSFKLTLTGSVIPYVLLYPMAFIVLRLYGYKAINNLIAAMIASSFLFLILCAIVTALPHDPNFAKDMAVESILHASFKMYLVGIFAMPIGIYSSFVALSFLSRFGLGFNVFTLSLATIIGELINTVIIMPLGLEGQFSLEHILNKIMVDALVYKFIMGVILSFFCVLIINIALKAKME